MFQGKRYFDCPSNKAFFTKAKKCNPDNRFQENFVHPQQSKGILNYHSRKLGYKFYFLLI